MAVIEVNDLSRSFGDTHAVDKLSFHVEKGEVFGFLGHNGAGKTTTVRLLNGVLQADGGTVSVLGLSPQTDGANVRKRTGVLTETPSLDERLSGYDNLSIYADLYGVPVGDVDKRVRELLATFDLSERGKDKVGGYSKGMKQRLALARALLHEPEILFLDEPTSGLDPVSSRQVHEMIGRISDEGRTVFLCTHNLIEAQRLCHRVAVMERGRIVAIGTTDELSRQIGGSMRYDIEIAVGKAEQAQLIIERVGFKVISSNWQQLTIQITDREDIPDVLAALTAGGVRVYSVIPQALSLEDVYFALYERNK